MWPLYRQLAQVPLLILRAEHSDLLSPATAAMMRDTAPDSTLATIPGVGHAPELSEPAAVAAIDEFLKRFEA
jgi:pimeloyl-ACP methyl ester carboxylesterase